MGIDRRQAEAHAQCLAEAVTLSYDDLVTKADLVQAVNRMLLAQIAIAGLLFGAIKLF